MKGPNISIGLWATPEDVR